MSKKPLENTQKTTRFQRKKTPNRTTFSRLLAKISLSELQEAFATFLLQLLQDMPLENSFHMAKDHWRDEDKHYLSMSGLGERFTCLLNRAVSVVKLLKKGKESLAAVSALIRDKPKKILKRLDFLN
jgi:hypothetical protein